jgi:NADH-quinone oxidoreductase subunit N
MNKTDLFALLPFLILSATAVVVMLVIAFRRSHLTVCIVTLAGLALSFLSLFPVAHVSPREVTPLMIIDGYSLFYTGLIVAAAFFVTLLSFGYLANRKGNREEYYLILVLATLGSVVLTASRHFASFFLGLEILSVSLYVLIAYYRDAEKNLEAGIKYLILAAFSAALLLFGMALVYAELGTMEFGKIVMMSSAGGHYNVLLLSGFALIVVGIGFKLGVVPFHMWTPDVYEGAPAPVTAFIATVSKGAMFALLIRYFGGFDIRYYPPLFLIFTIVAIASMLAGNLLALFQKNVKRILAYSSIAHLGYLLVAFEAGGARGVTAATFYLVAYFVTTLGAFGIVTVLSGKAKEAEDLEEYRGLAWRRPWLSLLFTGILLSLAGMPLTAGFIGKFYVAAAGVGAYLWLQVIVLVVSSAIGLFYYLRVINTLHTREKGEKIRVSAASLPFGAGLALAAIVLLLVFLGVYPSPLVEIIQATAGRLF